MAATFGKVFSCLNVLLWTCFVTVTLSHESVGLTFELPAQEKACFYEEFKEIRGYVLSYKVLRGGLQDVDVIVETPNNAVLYSEQKKKQDNFQFDSSWGVYTFCFSNEFSSLLHKVVYFELRPVEHKPLAVEAGKKIPTANTQLEESMEDIHRMNTQIIRFQRQYRLKESEGRFQAEMLSKGVLWWSTGQAVIIFLSGLTQVFLLKCFFTEKRKSTVLGEGGVEVVYAAPQTLL